MKDTPLRGQTRNRHGHPLNIFICPPLRQYAAPEPEFRRSTQRTVPPADPSGQSHGKDNGADIVRTARGQADTIACSPAHTKLCRRLGAERNAARETSGWDLKWCHGRKLLPETRCKAAAPAYAASRIPEKFQRQTSSPAATTAIRKRRKISTRTRLTDYSARSDHLVRRSEHPVRA